MPAKPGIGSLAIGAGLLTMAVICPFVIWRSPSAADTGVVGGTGWAWLLELAGMSLLTVGAGWLITGRYFGVLIDSRNRASLSRVQAALWTLVVLSALATAVLVNAHVLGGKADVAANLVKSTASALTLKAPLPFDAVNFSVPDELLAAIGIAGFSLVATPMAQSTKAAGSGTPVDPKALEAVQSREGAANVEADGNIFGRPTKSGAVWADIFRGDDIDSATTIDLSKVQQFVITLVLVGAYGTALWTMWSSQPVVLELPPLSQKFVWLLGISHAAYLANKVAPH